MSIDLNVYVKKIPSDIEAKWIHAAQKRGVICELRPGTELFAENETGPWLKVISLPESFKRTEPGKPLLVGFGFEFWAKEALSDTDEIPASVGDFIYCCNFRTSAGRSFLDAYFQFLMAISLAEVTDGVLEDPQSGDCFENAESLAEFVSQNLGDSGDDTGALLFTEWPPATFEEELKFKFPEPIGGPQIPAYLRISKKPWWKFW